jgi:hypothetical protein
MLQLAMILTIPLAFLSSGNLIESEAGYFRSFKSDSSEIERTYDRVGVLKKLARVLNRSCPQCKFHYQENGFYVDEDRLNGFFVFDLTDSLNRSFPKGNRIEFKENHVYHFAPKYFAHSYSHILILRKGKCKIFRSINCPGKGDDLSDVLRFMDRINLTDPQSRRNIMIYRNFGIYFAEDPQEELRCDKEYTRKFKRALKDYKRQKRKAA